MKKIFLYFILSTAVLFFSSSAKIEEPVNIKGWQTISLDNTASFNADARYRIKLTNSDGSKSSGWIYPWTISPSIILMTVSTAQFACGAITSNRKGFWHYRKLGDSANRPQGYENTEWIVAEIQMIID